jgi:hypothetical protein
MHTSHRWNTEALGLEAQATTRQTIPSGAKRWSSDKNCGFECLQMRSYPMHNLCLMVTEITIPADKRGNDLSVTSQGLFQQSPRSYCSITEQHGSVGDFFTAQTTKKGIEKMHDA